MSHPRQESPPEFLHLWPIETLREITEKPKKTTAVVIEVDTAANFAQRFLSSGLASCMVCNGVKLFALVGKESEQAHDALDYVVEENGALDVVTTWDSWDDPEDIANFVVTSSQLNRLVRIIVVTNDSMESGKRLKQSIIKFINFEGEDIH